MGDSHSKVWPTRPQKGPEMGCEELGDRKNSQPSWEVTLDLTLGGQ